MCFFYIYFCFLRRVFRGPILCPPPVIDWHRGVQPRHGAHREDVIHIVVRDWCEAFYEDFPQAAADFQHEADMPTAVRRGPG